MCPAILRGLAILHAAPAPAAARAGPSEGSGTTPSRSSSPSSAAARAVARSTASSLSGPVSTGTRILGEEVIRDRSWGPGEQANRGRRSRDTAIRIATRPPPWGIAAPRRRATGRSVATMSRHLGHRVALALLLAVLVGARGRPAAAATADRDRCPGRTAEPVLCLLNAARDRAGLRPLEPDARLARAAAAHAARHGRPPLLRARLAHGRAARDRVARTGWLHARRRWILGEVLAWGSGPLSAPAAIVGAWLDSPPHRAIVLRAGFRRIGIAAASGTPSGAAGATYAAELGAARPAVKPRGAAPDQRRRGRRRSRDPQVAATLLRRMLGGPLVHRHEQAREAPPERRERVLDPHRHLRGTPGA